MLSNLLFSCLSYLLSPVFSGLDVSLQFFFSAAGATSFSLCFSACLNFNPGLGSTCLIFPCFSFHIMSVHQCTEAGWRSQTLDRFRGFFLHWCYREASCCRNLLSGFLLLSASGVHCCVWVLETDIFKAQIEWNLWTVSSEIKKNEKKKTRPTHFYFRLTGYWFSLPWGRKRHFNKLKRQVGHKNLMWILLRKRSSVSQLRCSWGCVLDRGFVVLGTPLLWLHELCWENYRIQLNLYGYNMGCIYNYIYVCVCVCLCGCV